MRTLELLLPGLLGPVKDRDALAAIVPDLPALARLLARADRIETAPHEAEHEIGHTVGLPSSTDHLAALAYAGEGLSEDSGGGPKEGPDKNQSPCDRDRIWLRADPVHLRVDMAHARLFGPPALNLDAEEAHALTATLNTYLGDDGLRLKPFGDRWYLELAQMPELVTHPPSRVAGRNVDPFLPSGRDGPLWRGLMNEMQMLLHEHPINREREQRGQLPVNSVWIWGAGRLPDACPPDMPAAILADEPIAQGLARLAGQQPHALPASLDGFACVPGRSLLVDFSLRDPLVHGEAQAWLATLEQVERRWLQPALNQLSSSGLDQIAINTGGPRRFQLGRQGWRLRFWRRQRHWTTWMEAETSPEIDH